MLIVEVIRNSSLRPELFDTRSSAVFDSEHPTYNDRGIKRGRRHKRREKNLFSFSPPSSDIARKSRMFTREDNSHTGFGVPGARFLVNHSRLDRAERRCKYSSLADAVKNLFASNLLVH